MYKIQKLSLVIVLTTAMLVFSQGEAEAQRRGSSSRSGTYQRSNSQGKARQGSWQTQVNSEHGKGHRQRQRDTSVQTERGTATRQTNSRTERTGENTYNRNWDRTTTGPEGNSRTWTGEGQGSVNRTDNGYDKTYQGTVTSPKGNEYGVEKNTSATKTDQGWTKTTEKTVTDSQGNVIGTGTSSSNGTKGEGKSTEGSWTNQNTGNTSNYSARWRYVDGQWVREAESSRGSESTLIVEPSVRE